MNTPRIEDHADHTADVAAIRRIIADVEKGFNGNDVELLVEHFAQNGSAVDVMGAQIDGHEAMLESARAGLAGPLRDERARYELADVVFVRPDVALGRVWRIMIAVFGPGSSLAALSARPGTPGTTARTSALPGTIRIPKPIDPDPPDTP